MLTKPNPMGKAVRQKQQTRKMHQCASGTGTLEKYCIRSEQCQFYFLFEDISEQTLTF